MKKSNTLDNVISPSIKRNLEAFSEKPVDVKNLYIRNKEESLRLWNKYNSKQKPTHIREQLIKKYAHLVNWVIGRFPYIDCADFDREDLLGYGTIGLIESIDRYDPSQKCSFETFAITRIRGEILDFLRSRDFLTRRSRERVKRYNEAIAKLESELNRNPNDAEIKEFMEIGTEDLRNIKKEANALVFSLDVTQSTKSFEEAYDTLLDSIPANTESQEDYTESSLLRDKLAESIDKLGPRERLVVALYHYQKLTFKEIGEVLEISESRASQLHLKALQRLRVMLKDFEDSV
jgi:RNA polymerase sigma factor FliA